MRAVLSGRVWAYACLTFGRHACRAGRGALKTSICKGISFWITSFFAIPLNNGTQQWSFKGPNRNFRHRKAWHGSVFCRRTWLSSWCRRMATSPLPSPRRVPREVGPNRFSLRVYFAASQDPLKIQTPKRRWLQRPKCVLHILAGLRGNKWPCRMTHGSILGRMNIHLPPILMFTRGFLGFDPQPKVVYPSNL